MTGGEIIQQLAGALSALTIAIGVRVYENWYTRRFGRRPPPVNLTPCPPCPPCPDIPAAAAPRKKRPKKRNCRDCT